MTWLTAGHLKYLTFFGIVWLISSKWNVLIKNTNAFVITWQWRIEICLLSDNAYQVSRLYPVNIFFWSQVLPGYWRSSDNRKYVFEVLFVSWFVSIPPWRFKNGRKKILTKYEKTIVFSWIFVVLSEIYDEQNNNSNSNTKVALPHGCFFHVFKILYRWYQIARNIYSNCT